MKTVMKEQIAADQRTNHLLQQEEQLREIYGYAKGRAEKKVLNRLEKHCKHFLQMSPFLVIATYDKEGNVDVSPRGGTPGFVAVQSETEILIPDSKGNNRIDSMVNITQTHRFGSIFFIPGVDETLRINGHAEITTDPSILQTWKDERNPPKSAIQVTVEEVFLHCAKAMMRSALWNPSVQIERTSFPTIGEMLSDQLNDEAPAESQEQMVARYQKDL